MFPPLQFTGGISKLKFASEPVKNLTDHPRRFLKKHEDSEKHCSATRQYESKQLLCPF